jgi:hypothetical protein
VYHGGNVQFGGEFSSKDQAEKYCFHSSEIPEIGSKLLFLQLKASNNCTSIKDELWNWYFGLVVVVLVVALNGVVLMS